MGYLDNQWPLLVRVLDDGRLKLQSMAEFSALDQPIALWRLSEDGEWRHRSCLARPTIDPEEKTMRKIMACAVLLFAGVAVGANAQGAGEGVVKLPDQIEWKAPAVSPGPSTAVLYGDPSKAGVFVSRVKFPAGFKIMPHTHPDEWRTVAVLSGTIYFGLGDTWDDSKLQPRPTGTFFSEVKGAPHFVWAKDGEVIIQVTGMGPSGTILIPPK